MKKTRLVIYQTVAKLEVVALLTELCSQTNGDLPLDFAHFSPPLSFGVPYLVFHS
jgi:hypothetical protein